MLSKFSLQALWPTLQTALSAVHGLFCPLSHVTAPRWPISPDGLSATLVTGHTPRASGRNSTVYELVRDKFEKVFRIELSPEYIRAILSYHTVRAVARRGSKLSAYLSGAAKQCPCSLICLFESSYMALVGGEASGI